MGPKFKGIAKAKPVSPGAAKVQARLSEAVALHQPDLLPVIYDAAPSKQGKFMPGSHIPIEHPDELMNRPPDYVIVDFPRCSRQLGPMTPSYISTVSASTESYSLCVPMNLI